MVTYTTAHTSFANSHRWGITGPIAATAANGASGALCWKSASTALALIPPNTPYDQTPNSMIETMQSYPNLAFFMGGTNTETIIARATETKWQDGLSASNWNGNTGWTSTIDARITFSKVYAYQNFGFTGYYAPFYDLGVIKSCEIDTDSPTDVIGLPTQGDAAALAFDVGGVVTTIKIDGMLSDTTPATLSAKASALKNLQTGSQYTSTPCAFWCDMELNAAGEPVVYFVNVKNCKLKKTERDVNVINYSLTLVRRAYSI